MKITEGRRRAGGAADRPEVVRIRSALLDGVSAETSGRTDEERARVLLADLLDWHPRDDKPAWWRHFYLRTLSPAELIGEPDAPGGEVVGQVKRSVVRRFCSRRRNISSPRTGRAVIRRRTSSGRSATWTMRAGRST